MIEFDESYKIEEFFNELSWGEVTVLDEGKPEEAWLINALPEGYVKSDTPVTAYVLMENYRSNYHRRLIRVFPWCSDMMRDWATKAVNYIDGHYLTRGIIESIMS